MIMNIKAVLEFRSALGCGDWFLHSRHWCPLSVHLLRDCGIHSHDQLQCFDQLESISYNSATTFQSNANIMQLHSRQYNTDLFIPDCGGKSLPMANTYWHWEDSCFWEVGGFVQRGGALICRSRVRPRGARGGGEAGGHFAGFWLRASWARNPTLPHRRGSTLLVKFKTAKPRSQTMTWHPRYTCVVSCGTTGENYWHYKW